MLHDFNGKLNIMKPIIKPMGSIWGIDRLWTNSFQMVGKRWEFNLEKILDFFY